MGLGSKPKPLMPASYLTAAAVIQLLMKTWVSHFQVDNDYSTFLKNGLHDFEKEILRYNISKFFFISNYISTPVCLRQI